MNSTEFYERTAFNLAHYEDRKGGRKLEDSNATDPFHEFVHDLGYILTKKKQGRLYHSELGELAAMVTEGMDSRGARAETKDVYEIINGILGDVAWAPNS